MLTDQQLQKLTESQRREYLLLLEDGIVIADRHRAKSLNILCKRGIAYSEGKRYFLIKHGDPPPPKEPVKPAPKKLVYSKPLISDEPLTFKRASGVYSNRSQEQVIDHYLNL